MRCNGLQTRPPRCHQESIFQSKCSVCRLKQGSSHLPRRARIRHAEEPSSATSLTEPMVAVPSVYSREPKILESLLAQPPSNILLTVGLASRVINAASTASIVTLISQLLVLTGQPTPKFLKKIVEMAGRFRMHFRFWIWGCTPGRRCFFKRGVPSQAKICFCFFDAACGS